MNENDKVLIVDDDKEMRMIIGRYLENNDCNPIYCTDGLEAIDKIDETFDVIVLDIMMPIMDGIETLTKIRESYNTPVIFVSAKSTDVDKIQGLMTGADDYITKPFNPMDLVMRVKVAARRYKTLGSKYNEAIKVNNDQIKVRNIIIDTRQHQVTKNDKEIKLTKTEFDIFVLLAKNKGRVYSSNVILEQIFGSDSYYDSGNSIPVHISNLRNKINDTDKNSPIIINIWGVGYRIEK